MGLGIREPSGTGHVPGTVKLYESGLIAPGGPIEENGEGETARGTKKHAAEGVVLVPQPSDSPNDPLVSGTTYDWSW